MLCWIENLNEAFIEKDIISEQLFLNDLGFFSDLKRNIFKIISKDLVYKNIVKSIEKKILEFNPDLIFFISPFMFDKSIFQCFDNFPKIVKFAWIGDRFSSEHKKTAEKFNHLFYTDSSFVEEGKSFGFTNGSYLPLAVNNNKFFDKKLKRFDKLLFIASFTKQRMEFINQINSINLKLIGSKWDKVKLNNNIEYVNRNISIEKVSDEYNISKFILNIKHEHNVINGLNMRTFEAIASGGLLLQDYVKDVELNFEIDKNIVVYRNIDELNELIIRMKKNKFLFNNIITEGKKLVSEKHTYRNRVDSILELF